MRTLRTTTLSLIAALALLALPSNASAAQSDAVYPVNDQQVLSGSTIQYQVRVLNPASFPLATGEVSGLGTSATDDTPTTQALHFTPAANDPTLYLSQPVLQLESQRAPSWTIDALDINVNYVLTTTPPPLPTLTAKLATPQLMTGQILKVQVTATGVGNRAITVKVLRGASVVATKADRVTVGFVQTVQFRLIPTGKYTVVVSHEAGEVKRLVATVGPKIAKPKLRPITAKRTSATRQNVTLPVCAPAGWVSLFVSVDYIDSLGSGESLAYKERSFRRYHKGGCRSHLVGWAWTNQWLGYGKRRFYAQVYDRYGQISNSQGAVWVGDSRG